MNTTVSKTNPVSSSLSTPSQVQEQNSDSKAFISTISGSVPAQQPARSYANATKTASTTAPYTPSSHHAQDASMNGVNSTMAAQGSVQPVTNGNITNGTSDHTRKPSVVISASGTSGYTPNGGPVGQSARPPINFGMMNAQQSTQDQQTSTLSSSSDNPRVISPAHSPSPIPQPATSGGGRPPSSLQNQNGPAFGSITADASQPAHFTPATHMHERRPSSQSMQSGDSNMGRNYAAQAGRGRGGYPPQQQQYGSPAQAFRQLSNPGRPGMNQQFSAGPSNAQYSRPPGRQQSPAVGHVQPQMPHGYAGGAGGYQAQMYMPNYDAYSGYYQPYPYPGQFGSPGPSQSPRPPQYPNPYSNAAASGGQPPFMPQNMARTPSQASDRPGSSIGHPGTPNQAHVVPSQPGSAQASSNFVRPVKKSNPIKITNAKGETINFAKPAATTTAPTTTSTPQTSTPIIAHTPNAATPPPRTPSAQHVRAESKATMSESETREAFKRQVEEKRKQEEAQKGTTEKPADAAEVVKEAAISTEKAAAVAADDTVGAEAAKGAVATEEETEEQRKKREADEEEALIAEMEAAEREEEEREKAFQEKRKKQKEESAKKEAEAAAKADDELKRQEREAEARELEREREREQEKKSDEETDDEAKNMFASLKKPTLGPGASATDETPDTPVEEEETPAESAPRAVTVQKPKPAHLKLETSRKVEPAEPTPGMQALKSARFLEIKEDALYPEGIKSPNPALNANGSKRGRAYDKDFLLQFQNVFREKPSVDWDQKVRDTLGADEPGSARPQSARTPSGAAGRSASQRGPSATANFGGQMGAFGSAPQGRTLPVGTTSQERFMASQRGMGMPGQLGRMPSNLGMGAPMGINRTNSLQNMGPGSPRQPSSRGGKGASKRDNRAPSRKEEAELAARMPLTAAGEVKALEKSTSGWTARSITAGPMANAPALDGHMAPDMVQRKVKAALNKMTPEKFDKISDQILEIASQSKSETDGRTLRQVIQLTFEKACDEAHWAGMYAQFCHKMLTAMSPEIRDETIKDKSGAAVVGGALFRKYLLNRCQEEFERGWQVNLPDKPEGAEGEAALLSDEYYIAAAAKRKGLGLIQFIGQLYKLNMLTSRIMHECVLRLLNFEGAPDEAAIENLTTLLKSVGSTMDAEQQGHVLVDTYFARIKDKILDDADLPSRSRFMIMDLMDLRKAGWQGKDDSKGPKTIQQIHQEAELAQAKAEAERQRTRTGAGRAPGGRQDSRNFSGQMAPPVDYSRTNVSTDDLRRLQTRGNSSRNLGGGLGPGGNLGASLSARAGSRRGIAAPGSGNSTRTSTPPVGDKDKKEEPAAQQNSFSALEDLETEEVESPEVSRDRSKSPLPDAKAEDV